MKEIKLPKCEQDMIFRVGNDWNSRQASYRRIAWTHSIEYTPEFVRLFVIVDRAKGEDREEAYKELYRYIENAEKVKYILTSNYTAEDENYRGYMRGYTNA